MTYLPSNDARNAPHDALAPVKGFAGRMVGFNRYWTARAVRLLRTVQNNPFIRQKRNNWGSLDANGHGAVCANQLLIEMLDNLRNAPDNRSLIDRLLPISHGEIITLNDERGLTFAQIADEIEQRAGGPQALIGA